LSIVTMFSCQSKAVSDRSRIDEMTKKTRPFAHHYRRRRQVTIPGRPRRRKLANQCTRPARLLSR